MPSAIHPHVLQMTESRAAMHRTRARLYLIAAGLFDQPDQNVAERLWNLIEELLAESLFEAPWLRAVVSLTGHRGADRATDVEYTRLFVLAFPRVAAQPYGSYWLEQDHYLFGVSALEVQEMMATHGLMVREESGLMPDHIVSELEFMAYLASQGDTTIAAQERLLGGHLARWVPRFTAALREAQPSPYYRLAADFLDQLIQWDQAQLPRIKDQSETTLRSFDSIAGEQVHEHV